MAGIIDYLLGGGFREKLATKMKFVGREVTSPTAAIRDLRRQTNRMFNAEAHIAKLKEQIKKDIQARQRKNLGKDETDEENNVENFIVAIHLSLVDEIRIVEVLTKALEELIQDDQKLLQSAPQLKEVQTFLQRAKAELETLREHAHKAGEALMAA